MEEKEKYYTPEIEEFHVGFEYEYKESFQDGTVKSEEQYNNAKWIKDFVKIGDYPYIKRALTGRNADKGLCGIRVKHLDKEDIEELGWTEKSVFDNDGTKSSYWNPVNECIITLYNKDHKVRISGGTNIPRFLFFHGTIKNKSELKKLMQQLNIIE